MGTNIKNCLRMTATPKSSPAGRTLIRKLIEYVFKIGVLMSPLEGEI
jgi:hypothetical protein